MYYSTIKKTFYENRFVRCRTTRRMSRMTRLLILDGFTCNGANNKHTIHTMYTVLNCNNHTVYYTESIVLHYCETTVCVLCIYCVTTFPDERETNCDSALLNSSNTACRLLTHFVLFAMSEKYTVEKKFLRKKNSPGNRI